jgi:hypothetical protein
MDTWWSVLLASRTEYRILEEINLIMFWRTWVGISVMEFGRNNEDVIISLKSNNIYQTNF